MSGNFVTTLFSKFTSSSDGQTREIILTQKSLETSLKSPLIKFEPPKKKKVNHDFVPKPPPNIVI